LAFGTHRASAATAPRLAQWLIAIMSARTTNVRSEMSSKICELRNVAVSCVFSHLKLQGNKMARRKLSCHRQRGIDMTAILKDDRARNVTTPTALPGADTTRMRPVAVPTTTKNLPTQSTAPLSSSKPIQCHEALALCMLDTAFGG